MKRSEGFGVYELLISLFLVSILLVTLVQFYLACKVQYTKLRKQLDSRFDLQWVNDLLADSIRRAGFTPCLGLDELETIDRRNGRPIVGLTIEHSPQEVIQIKRMSELFARVYETLSPNTLLLAKMPILNAKRPVLIADCYHAEVQEIERIEHSDRGNRLLLKKPLFFAFEGEVYVGEYLEEKWFIKKNPRGRQALYYQSVLKEELTASIHALSVQSELIHNRRFIEVHFEWGDDKTHQLAVSVRGS